jgi:hypothetical protein
VTRPRARYTVESAGELGPELRIAVLDCPHGTTTAVVAGTSQCVSEHSVFAALAARHEAEERCGCARSVPPPTAEGARA